MYLTRREVTLSWVKKYCARLHNCSGRGISPFWFTRYIFTILFENEWPIGKTCAHMILHSLQHSMKYVSSWLACKKKKSPSGHRLKRQLWKSLGMLHIFFLSKMNTALDRIRAGFGSCEAACSRGCAMNGNEGDNRKWSRLVAGFRDMPTVLWIHGNMLP